LGKKIKVKRQASLSGQIDFFFFKREQYILGINQCLISILESLCFFVGQLAIFIQPYKPCHPCKAEGAKIARISIFIIGMVFVLHNESGKSAGNYVINIVRSKLIQ
jgi:hypothetical protein